MPGLAKSIASLPEPPSSQIEESIETILSQVPFVRLKGWKRGAPLQGRRVDLVLDLMAGRERWRVLVEAKGSGEPRLIRGAIQQLRTCLSGARTYGVVAAPYIGPRSREICKEEGVGFVDQAGNCRLAFGQVFIERQGFSNPKVERRPLRNLFTPKASRVLRVLLEEAERSWQVQAMAQKAQVSLGLAFKVKQRLLDLEYAREEDKGLRLTRPEELLRQWAENYSYLKSSPLDCFASGELPEIERTLADYCRKNKIRYAFTLFSGAARTAPFARYSRGFAYAESDAAKLAKALGWKPVPSGANFTILNPFDEGLFYAARRVNGETVASDIQLYLDLAGYKGRGEEAATFILEQRLRPRW